MPTRGHFSRSRSIDDLTRKLKVDIRKYVKNAKAPVRVLELGCGEGRVLMQLRKLFPASELYGINKSPWPAMKGSQSLKRTGTYYKIFTKKEINKIKLPKIYFYDASKKLRFKDNYFDVIYSQVAIHYFERKDMLLEEVWRVLKPGGYAFLHIDTYGKHYPDFMQHPSPRFLIYKNDKLYPLKNFVSDLKKKGYDVSYKNRLAKPEPNLFLHGVNLFLHKNKKNLKLNLKFDEQSSFNLMKLAKTEKDKHIFWGHRSVYRI